MRDDRTQAVFPDVPQESPRSKNITRRGFIQVVGGITVYFSLGDPLALLAQEGRRRDSRYPSDFNAYVRIEENGRVTCCVGKIEMGQGIITGLAQMCAEELDLTLDRIDMLMGDTDLCPYDMLTVGSLTTRQTGPRLRAAAAEAKAILLQLAGEKLGVPAGRLSSWEGAIFEVSRPDRKVTFAELAGGKKIERYLEGEPVTKPSITYSVCGKRFDRTDGNIKVTGEARFTGDIKIDGMLFARILRSPAHGAALAKLDTSAAEKMPGVQVVRDGDLVAVLHEQFDAASAALDSIEAEWREPEATLDNDNIHEHLAKVAPEGDVVAESGDLAEGGKLAATTFEESYYNGYVAHAPMETHSALAHVQGDRATLWASTQGPFALKEQIAGTLGLPSENVRIITPFVGGGYGGKTRAIQADEAAKLSKLSGKPVMVVWTRRDEFFHDSFMPAALIRIRSGLDAEARVVFWDYEALHSGSRSSEPFYAFPHHRVVSRGGWGGGDGSGGAHPFAVGAWRGPGSNSNNFARETHIDLMAAAVGMDPVEFRLVNLTDKRMVRVLETAASEFGWQPAKTPSGRGHGVACVNYNDTYVVTCAEVEVDEKTGAVRVKRMVCAQDMGEIVNPSGAEAQVHGGLIMGLGFALGEEIQFKGGKILNRAFSDYHIARFSWLPEIKAVLVNNPGQPHSGGGEPAITTVGAVIANAVNDATGLRLNRLPLTPERILAALAARA